jgi:hypothetical protein
MAELAKTWSWGVGWADEEEFVNLSRTRIDERVTRELS